MKQCISYLQTMNQFGGRSYIVFSFRSYHCETSNANKNVSASSKGVQVGKHVTCFLWRMV